MASGLESSTEKPKKKKQRRKKGKKSSIWRSIVGFFSRGDSDTDERDLSPVRTVCPPQPPEATCLSISKPFSEGEEVTRRRKSSRRRRSLIRRLSQKKDRRLSIVEGRGAVIDQHQTDPHDTTASGSFVFIAEMRDIFLSFVLSHGEPSYIQRHYLP